MIYISLFHQLQGQIRISDLHLASFSENEFNAIFALDTLKYIRGKEELLTKFKVDIILK